MQEEAEQVLDRAKELEENATKLREADVEGAYNITKESALRSQVIWMICVLLSHVECEIKITNTTYFAYCLPLKPSNSTHTCINHIHIQAAKRKTETADSYVAQSETKRREADQLFTRNQDDFDKQYQENQEALDQLAGKVSCFWLVLEKLQISTTIKG